MIGWKQHWSVAERLRRANQHQPAIEVLVRGVERFPDEERLRIYLSRVRDELRGSNMPDAERMIAELEALGYLGDIDGD